MIIDPDKPDIWAKNIQSDTEINEAVARKLGWTYYSNSNTWGRPNAHPQENTARSVPDYVTDIRAAWGIVNEYVENSGWDFNMQGGERYGGAWQVNFLKDGEWQTAEADTPSRAICLAFLKLP